MEAPQTQMECLTFKLAGKKITHSKESKNEEEVTDGVIKGNRFL
jgi:hypothetical protein